jgi:hypothetical protein
MHLRYLFIVLATLAALTTFQNCGDVAINEMPLESPPLPMSAPFQIHLCSEPLDTELEAFVVDPIVIVNLTSRVANQNGVLTVIADSDIDGIPDSSDSEPQNRSLGSLMGGICDRLGGSPACDQGLACTMTARSFGLSNCDKLALALTTTPAQPNNTADFDRDLIPDFVELLFNSDPKGNNLNPDGDLLLSLDEFRVGRHPSVSDDSLAKGFEMRWRPQLVNATNDDSGISCPDRQQHWKVLIEQIPLVQTMSFSDSNRLGDLFDFSHNENENLILVYFYARNSLNTKNRIYSTLFKLREGETPMNVTPDQFLRLGEFNGN